MTEYNCGYACGFMEPHGFVPETGCPIHDTAELSAIINATIVKERERCAQVAFDIGYPLADEANVKLDNGWTASDLVVDASEKIAAAIRNPPPGSQVAAIKRKGERAMSGEKMRIEVQYSTDGLFGATDLDDYDEKASIAQFGEALTNHLYEAYPDAEIAVTHGISDCIKVDGQQDHEETPWIEQIIEKVYNGDDWLESW